MKLLTLLQFGGSLEAFTLAEHLVQEPALRLITSFAGRTNRRRAIAGEDRVGHFGGVEGLISYCQTERVDALLDATHPFASGMKNNVAEAARRLNLPCLFWKRDLWQAQTGDRWISAKTTDEVAETLCLTDSPVFLAIGRQDIAPFARRKDLTFVIRLIETDGLIFDHPNSEFVIDRGPFLLKDERAFFDQYKPRCLVCKNSGGEAARAKLTVARERNLPVYMINRPPLPQGQRAESLGEVLDWLRALRSQSVVQFR